MSGVSFELSLVDKVTAPSRAAANGFQLAATQAAVLQKAMVGIENQAIKAAAAGDIGKMGKLSKSYEQFGAQLGLLEGQFPGANAAIAQQAAAAKAAKTALVDQTQAMSGATAGAGEMGNGLGALLSPMTAVATVALSVAATLGSLVIAGAKMSYAVSEAREKSVTLFDALSDGRESGESIVNSLDTLRMRFGMTRAQIQPLSQSMMAMGIQGDELKTQLTALASVQAFGIDGGEQEYLKILKETTSSAKIANGVLTNLSRTGVGYDEISQKMGVSQKQLREGLKAGTIDSKVFAAALTKAVTEKGMGPLARQAGSLDAQLSLLKESGADLFVLPKEALAPFSAGMKDLVGLISQNTASGRALKAGLTGAFTAIFSAASQALPYIKVGFELMVIAGLEAYIAVKKFFSGEQGAARMAATMGTLAFTAKLVAGSVALIAAAGMATVAAFVWLGKTVIDTIAFLQLAVKAAEKVGGDIAEGFANGIRNGIGKITEAAKSMGAASLFGVRTETKTHSPSQEQAKIGAFQAEGFAGGMRSGIGDVNAASSEMAQSSMQATRAGIAAPSPSSVARAPSGEGKAGRSGGSVTIQAGAIAAGAIQINGANSPQETLELFETSLATVIERLGLSQGLSVTE